MLRLLAEGEVKAQAPGIGAIYDLEETAVEPGEGCHTIFTPDGVFQLHYSEHAEETLSMLQCWDYLRSQGPIELAKLRVTSSGDLGFYVDDRLTYLTTKVGGRRGELGLKWDAVQIAPALARLHLRSQKLPVSLQVGVKRSEPIRPALALKREELDLFRNMALHRLYPKAFDVLFLEIYGPVALLTHRSIELLTELSIDRLETDPELVGLLLGNCDGRRFRVTDDRQMQLPDLRKTTWGLLAQDLVTLLSNIGEYTEGSLAIAQRVLTAYQKIRPFHQYELGAIYGLALFPEGLWEIANDYYKGNRKLDESEAVEALRGEWERVANQQKYWQWLLGDELG